MNVVEFAILLKDKASSTIEKIGREFSNADTKAKGLKGTVSGLTGVFGGLKNMLGMIGVGFGFYKVVDMLRSGVDKAHELRLANAQIEAGLRSTNYAAGMTMDTLDKSVDRIKSQSLYGGAQLKNMQSVLLTFPKVGKNLFDPASQSIVDMATRMKQDLPHAAIMVGKALQDPATGVMMMRRIGVNFTKEQVKHFKELVGAGKLEEAQILILKELNTEFGGSAKAAFDATPMAQYNKVVASIQIKLGELALKAQNKIAPTLIWMANSVKNSIVPLSHAFAWIYNAITNGNPAIWGAIIAFTAYHTILTLIAIKTQFLTWYMGLSSAAIILNSLVTEGLSAAWLALNMAMEANPLMWIMTLIGLLVSAIIYAWQKFGWFRGGVMEAWEALKGLGNIIMQFVVDTLGSLFKGLGHVGDALYKLFKGDFKGAFEEGKSALNDFLLIDASNNAINKARLTGKSMASAYHKGVQEVENNKLSDKKIPGTNKGYGSMTSDKAGSKQAVTSVASGGTRNTSIYITVGKMVESLIYQGGVGETAQDVEKKFEEILMRVLFAAESAS